MGADKARSADPVVEDFIVVTGKLYEIRTRYLDLRTRIERADNRAEKQEALGELDDIVNRLTDLCSQQTYQDCVGKIVARSTDMIVDRFLDIAPELDDRGFPQASAARDRQIT